MSHANYLHITDFIPQFKFNFRSQIIQLSNNFIGTLILHLKSTDILELSFIYIYQRRLINYY